MISLILSSLQPFWLHIHKSIFPSACHTFIYKCTTPNITTTYHSSISTVTYNTSHTLLPKTYGANSQHGSIFFFFDSNEPSSFYFKNDSSHYTFHSLSASSRLSLCCLYHFLLHPPLLIFQFTINVSPSKNVHVQTSPHHIKKITFANNPDSDHQLRCLYFNES